jgi:dynein light chain Tctex-type 1
MDEETVFDGMTEEDLMDDAEVDSMVREAINAAVGDNQFLHSKIDLWSNNIVEGCLKRLAAVGKPFKYIVTCNLMQKAGAGLHAASCTRSNEKTDGKLTVQWENNTMIVLVTVYWLGAYAVLCGLPFLQL